MVAMVARCVPRTLISGLLCICWAASMGITVLLYLKINKHKINTLKKKHQQKKSMKGAHQIHEIAVN